MTIFNSIDSLGLDYTFLVSALIRFDTVSVLFVANIFALSPSHTHPPTHLSDKKNIFHKQNTIWSMERIFTEKQKENVKKRRINLATKYVVPTLNPSIEYMNKNENMLSLELTENNQIDFGPLTNNWQYIFIWFVQNSWRKHLCGIRWPPTQLCMNYGIILLHRASCETHNFWPPSVNNFV